MAQLDATPTHIHRYTYIHVHTHIYTRACSYTYTPHILNFDFVLDKLELFSFRQSTKLLPSSRQTCQVWTWPLFGRVKTSCLLTIQP